MTVANVNGKKVPPDGGYGWVVMCAHALNMSMTLPLFFSFGLVFKEAMSDVGLSQSRGSLVLILNSSIGMIISFFGGPLLRRFGYRKVAVTGAIFASLGLLITAIGSSFWMFILSYSVMNSMGSAAAVSGSTLAINSFFKEKRGRAIGVAISLMGLGAIVMPQLISGLLTAFGWRYTVLTLSAMSLHTLVAACLLRPAKWYLKYPTHLEEMMPLNKGTNIKLINANVLSSTKENDYKSEENAAFSTKTAPMISPFNVTILQNSNTLSHHHDGKSSEALTFVDQSKWWESQEVNLGSSINIFYNEEDRKVSDSIDKVSGKVKQPKSLLRKFVDIFDLTLLNDPIFVNILVGMAITSCAERNFLVLLAIILDDMMQFETEEIAKLMSIIGVADTVFRFVSPFLGEWLKQPPRAMYVAGLLIYIIFNTAMLFTSSFVSMAFLALVIGVGKGYRLVYVNIIIPSYAPIERLPFALGLQNLCNGVTGICIGSIVGRLRETTGSYQVPIIVLNFITMLTIISWSAEFLYFRIKNKKICMNF